MSNQEIHNTTTSNGHSIEKAEGLQVIDGREYYEDLKVAYVLPKDTDELSRLHKQHLLLRSVFQGLFIVPLQKSLEEGITVLDSGCGPGAWTLDMCSEYPNSKFHGIDISNVFPEDLKPNNCEFVIGNISERIPFPDNTFHYVHQRLLFLGLTDENWDSTLKEIFRVLKPGGYIELTELDAQKVLNMGPLLKKLQELTKVLFVSRGLPENVCSKIESRLNNTGYVNQSLKINPVSLNFGGKAGDLMWEDYKHAYMNVRPIVAKSIPAWEDEEAYESYIDECGSEASKNESKVNWYTYVAQKPLN